MLAAVSATGCGGGQPDGFAAPHDLFGDAGPAPAKADGGNWPCSGLECQRVSCPAGTSTTLSGVVYTPSKDNADPVYNAVVYVPNAPLQPFTPGVACEQCGAPVSGSPVAVTLSGSDGRFVLPDVPAGRDIPVVLQVGRWRKEFTLPSVVACQDNPIPDTLTHLPANHMEGEIPHIAIATGAVDPLECVLLKIGLDPDELTTPDKAGRVHVYESNGSSMTASSPPGSALWSSLATLEQYDMVLLPCEGEPNYKPTASAQNLIDYTSAGGRVFTTHYGYVWIQGAPAPFSSTADWMPDNDDVPSPLGVTINTSFPKGQALAEWLWQAGVSPSFGQMAVYSSRHDTLKTKGAAVPWLTASVPGPSVQEYTFNTPVGVPADKQCGRVSFSDFHVNLNEMLTTSGSTFPVECDAQSSTLTAQEKVIEFMLFDLASCIQDEMSPPSIPK